ARSAHVSVRGPMPDSSTPAVNVAVVRVYEMSATTWATMTTPSSAYAWSRCTCRHTVPQPLSGLHVHPRMNRTSQNYSPVATSWQTVVTQGYRRDRSEHPHDGRADRSADHGRGPAPSPA